MALFLLVIGKLLLSLSLKAQAQVLTVVLRNIVHLSTLLVIIRQLQVQKLINANLPFHVPHGLCLKYNIM